MPNKIIPFNVAIKSTATRRSYDIPKAYTNDLNSVEFQFTITDMTAGELTTAKANVLLYMLDGSFFENNEASGVAIEGNVVTYTMKSNEGNHSGVNEAQVEIIYEGAPDKKLASQKYEFEIINGLDMEVAVEIVVKDWSALTTEARKFIDDSTVEVNALKNELQNSIETANTSLGEFDIALQNGIVATNIAAELQNLETTYAPELVSLRTSLEQADDKSNLIGWELQNKTRDLKPLITFVDDDAYPAVLTKLKPLSDTYGIPFVVAAISSRVDVESYSLTSAQLKALQDVGWEISSHTHTHADLTPLTDAEQEYQMRTSKEILEGKGLKVTTICYPFGGRNANTHKFVRKYYRGGRRTDDAGRINLAPLETYDIVCTPLGAFPDKMPNPPFPTNSLDFYKYQVDKAVSNNGWLIFMTHVSDPAHDATQQNYLEQTIQYVQSLGVDVVTLNEGLDRRGNIVDIGRYDSKDLSKKHLVIGADGSYSGSELQSSFKFVGSSSVLGLTPKQLPTLKTLACVISQSDATTYNFPEIVAGILITTSYNSSYFADGMVRQIYRPNSKNMTYERYGLTDSTWSEWQQTTFIKRLATNTVTLNSVVTDFPSGLISKCIITTTAGAPDTMSGVLTTDRSANHNYYSYQTYELSESHSIYKRYWINSTSQWSTWRRLNSTQRTTSARNWSDFPKMVGDMVFDITLGKPIWWNGTAWVDSAGVNV